MSDRTERIAKAIDIGVHAWHNEMHGPTSLGEHLAPLVERAIEAAANVRIDSAMAQDWAWDAALHALEGK